MSSNVLPSSPEIVKVMTSSAKAFPDPPGKTTLYYTYFGHIIDVALRILADNDSEFSKTTKVLLGNAKFSIPTDENGGAKQEIVNLYDLPISWNLFTTFFYEAIVKPQRQVLLFRDFLNLIIDYLFLPAIRGDCVVVPSAGNALALDVMTFTISGDEGKTFDDMRDSMGRISDAQKLSKVRNAYSTNVFDSLAKDSVNYMFLSFSIPYSPKIGYGEPEKSEEDRYNDDMNQGVFHFYVGNDRGPVKRVKFVANEANREVNIIKATEQNQSLIQDYFDTEILMFPNPFFMPGQLYYVSPTIVGYGNMFNLRSDAATLGMGGYYMIYQVETILETGKYETTLRGLNMIVRMDKTTRTAGGKTFDDIEGTGIPSAQPDKKSDEEVAAEAEADSAAKEAEAEAAAATEGPGYLDSAWTAVSSGGIVEAETDEEVAARNKLLSLIGL